MICSWCGFEKNQIQRMANLGECLKWICFIRLKIKLINNNKRDLVHKTVMEDYFFGNQDTLTF